MIRIRKQYISRWMLIWTKWLIGHTFYLRNWLFHRLCCRIYCWLPSTISFWIWAKNHSFYRLQYCTYSEMIVNDKLFINTETKHHLNLKIANWLENTVRIFDRICCWSVWFILCNPHSGPVLVSRHWITVDNQCFHQRYCQWFAHDECYQRIGQEPWKN